MHASKKRPITRNRELLACTECRRRKLKCDRNKPCGSCVKREDAASCTYQRLAHGDRERERRMEAESRLEHLEGLVQQLAASQAAKPDESSGESSTLQTNDQLNVSLMTPAASANLPYVGDTHWSAMLEDIDELRQSIAVEEELPGDLSNGFYSEDTMDFIFGAAIPLPFEQILLQYLPSRQETDSLIGAYFRSTSVVPPFIHAAHFRRRYQQFWISPKDAPPLWTSMLFTICYISSTVVAVNRIPEPSLEKFLYAAAQCLAVGKYYKTQRFAVESLLLFAQSRCFGAFDITPDLGMIMASVMRLATTSGYHKDPDGFALSVFDKEMRRRTWSLCMQLDLLICFALGLPSTIPFSTTDTRQPRNLLDSDFDEDAAVLPESRPDSEPTAILFYIAKHRLMKVFEKIVRYSLSSNTSSLPDRDALEMELKDTYSALPSILKPRSVAESVVDSSRLVVTRLCTLFMYQKCRCVLHRKYAVQGRKESLEICYEGSWSIVGYFIDIFPDLQGPGGQFENERWFNSTLTWHDFMLGATVLCLVLCVESQQATKLTIDYDGSKILLQRAQEVCNQVSSKSRYTVRVQKLIDATLSHLDNNAAHQTHLPGTNGNILSDFPAWSSTTDPQPAVEAVATANMNAGQQFEVPLDDNVWMSGWSEPAAALDDISWQYLDQFLNLPADESIMEM